MVDVSFNLEATLDIALYGMCGLLSLLVVYSVNFELLGLCVIDHINHKINLEQQF